MPNIGAWVGDNEPEQYEAMRDHAADVFPYTASVSGMRGTPRAFGVVYASMPFRFEVTSPRMETSENEYRDVPITPTGYYPQRYHLIESDQITFNSEVFEVIDVFVDQTPLGFSRVSLQRAQTT